MAQSLQAGFSRNTRFENSNSKGLSQASVKDQEIVSEEETIIHSMRVAPLNILEVGAKVRHTRFLNTNGPEGTFVLELADQKALCQYIDCTGKTRQTWFLVNDLIKA
jgi:hypothetical protein